MEKFYYSLREHAMKIINFEKKKMIPLTHEEYESYLNQLSCHICRKRFDHKYTNDKNYRKVKNHCHYTGVVYDFRGSGYFGPKKLHKKKNQSNWYVFIVYIQLFNNERPMKMSKFHQHYTCSFLSPNCLVTSDSKNTKNLQNKSAIITSNTTFS